MKKLNSKIANTALSIGIGAAGGALGGALSPALTRVVPNTTQRAVMGAKTGGSGMAVVSSLSGLIGPRRRRKMQEETIKQFYKNRLNEALNEGVLTQLRTIGGNVVNATKRAFGRGGMSDSNVKSLYTAAQETGRQRLMGAKHPMTAAHSAIQQKMYDPRFGKGLNHPQQRNYLRALDNIETAQGRTDSLRWQNLGLKEGLQRYKRVIRGAAKRLNRLRGPSDPMSLDPKVPSPRWRSMIPGEEVWNIKDPVHRAAQDQFRKDMDTLKGMKGSFSKPSRFELRRANSERRGAERIVGHVLGKPGPAGIKRKTGKNIRNTVQGHQMDWYRLGSMIDDNVTGKASQPWKRGPVV